VNSWKVILATMVIFGTGVITGGLLVKDTTPPEVRHPNRLGARTNQQPANIALPQMMRMEFLFRVNDELQLTAKQHERVEKIIREGQEKSRKIWEGVAPEMRKELQAINDRIRAELTEEQRARFNQLIKNGPRQPPGNPKNNPPMLPDRMRDRIRQGGDMQFNPNAPQRPFRRDFPNPPNNPGGPQPPRQPPNPQPSGSPSQPQPPSVPEPAPDAPPAQQ
jgi:hypothetical protein